MVDYNKLAGDMNLLLKRQGIRTREIHKIFH